MQNLMYPLVLSEQKNVTKGNADKIGKKIVKYALSAPLKILIQSNCKK